MGLNSKLQLTKEVLGIKDGNPQFVTQYTSYIDYNTMVIDEYVLRVNFNGNEITSLIKSYESDDFEIERLKDVEGNDLEEIQENTFYCEGRDILVNSSTVIRPYEFEGNQNYPQIFGNSLVSTESIVCTKIEQDNFDRFEQIVKDGETYPDGSNQNRANNLYFSGISANSTIVRNTSISGDIEVDLKIDFDGKFSSTAFQDDIWIEPCIRIYSYSGTEEDVISDDDAEYTLISEDILERILWEDVSQFPTFQRNYERKITLKWNETLVYLYKGSRAGCVMYSQNVSAKIVEDFAPSPSLKFNFVYDVFERLIQIMTGDKYFYSKFFAVENQVPSLGQKTYLQRGYGGLVGLTTGLWMRNFKKEDKNYKSLGTNFKSMYDSCHAIFNIGMGVEYVSGFERVRIESLDYFYQDEVVIRLGKVKNIERSVDSSLYFSGLSFGYKKGGDYNVEMGLDEPNIKNEFITPLNKTQNKYEKISEIRADEYGMEQSRRRPINDFPDEEDGSDTDLFFLDMYLDEPDIPLPGVVYPWKQKEWPLRLSNEPTGIFRPNSFKSSFFTPIRALLRHAWVFATGLQRNRDSSIQYSYGEGNAQLETSALSYWSDNIDNEPNKENEDRIVSELPRPKFSPQIIKFEYAVNQNLLNLVLAKTEKEINGVAEDVPNTYFQVEFINEKDEKERGYLMNLNPDGQGLWSLQKTNDDPIY